MTIHLRRAIGCAAILLTLGGSGGVLARPAEQPETVMVTLHAKPGAADELARVIAGHWATTRRLNLVHESPHLTLRGSEAGNQVYFVEIFTWRDAAIPDAAPEEIHKIWDEMNRLVESRGGHAGLEFSAMSVVP